MPDEASHTCIIWNDFATGFEIQYKELEDCQQVVGAAVEFMLSCTTST